MRAFNDIVSMSKQDWAHVLEWVNAGLTVALLVRLSTLKLRGFLASFFAFLVVDLLGLSLSFVLRMPGPWLSDHRLDYRPIFIVLILLEVLIATVMVYQLLQSITNRYPGIHRMARRTLAIAIVAATVTGLVSFSLEFSRQQQTIARDSALAKTQKSEAAATQTDSPAKPTPQDEGAAFYAYAIALTVAIDQNVSIVLLLMIVIMLVFFLWFPIDLSRNTAVFTAGSVVFFAMKSLTLFIPTTGPGPNDFIDNLNIVIAVISGACCLYWVFSMNPAQQEVEITIGHRWNPLEQDRLLGKLDAINATLLRSARPARRS